MSFFPSNNYRNQGSSSKGFCSNPAFNSSREQYGRTHHSVQNRTQNAASNTFSPTHSSSSSSSSSSTPSSRLSNQNQADEFLNFKALNKAKPIFEEELDGKLTLDDIRKTDHDGAILIINDYAAKNTFLPLSYISCILTKFTNERFGTVADAEELFYLAKKKYRFQVGDLRFAELYKEMMWVYIGRKDVSNKTLRKNIPPLFAECTASETRDALLRYHNKLNEFKTTIKLYEECNLEMPKSDYAIRYYIKAFRELNSKEDTKAKLYSIENVSNRMNEVTFFSDFLSEIIGLKGVSNQGLEELIEYFEAYPHQYNEDKSRRFLLNVYLNRKQFDKAEECFANWPEGKMTQQTLEDMITKTAKYNLHRAIEIFTQDVQNEGIFDDIEIDDRDSEEWLIKMDFHNNKRTRDGNIKYGGDSNFLIAVKLWYLYGRLANMNGNQAVRINIITGQGKYCKTRTLVHTLLEEEVHWKAEAEYGEVITKKQTIETLRELKLQHPVLINKASTPNYFPN